MPLTYNTLLRQLAIVTNSFGDATTPLALDTAYDTVPLTAANFTSATGAAMFPFGFLKEQIVNAQEGLIFAIASTPGQPLRESILSTTNPLAYGDLINVDVASLPVIGVCGAVYDADDNEPCTLNELEIIRMKRLSPWMVLPVYEYAIQDKRIYHTRTNVIVDVCVYQRPDVDTLNLTSNIILPDVLGEAIVDGAAMMCFNDSEYLNQAARAGELYLAWITAIRNKETGVQVQSNPTPDAQKAYAA